VYVMNTDGSGIRQLTQLEAAGGPSIDFPAWSPDGQRIAVVSTRAPTYALYEIAIDDGRVRQLQSSQDFAYGRPSWSPDGTRLALSGVRVVNGVRENTGIYLVNADGSGLVRLTTGEDGFASWSPDGARIAFQRRHPDSSGWIHIHLVRLEDLKESQLTFGNSAPALLNLTPVWSPGSQKIAFIHSTAPRQLLVMSAGGSDVAPLSPSHWAHISLPAWTRGGSVPP
jgi:Tol biopolymer transport system component